MKKILSIIILVVSAVCVVSCSKTAEKPSKVWLHRANDVAKARYFQDKYAGFEVDVHFVDSLNTFVVQHDFGANSKLRLEDWFASIDNRSNLGFWIDFKNLDYSNMKAAAKELARLRKTYKLKGMIIVESSDPECLKVFDNLNFRTSYYIPYINPKELNQEELQDYTNSIRRNVKKNNLNTISGFYSQYQYMIDSFPELHKLTWYERTWDTAVRNYYINLANEDPKTDVILIAVKDTIDYSSACLLKK